MRATRRDFALLGAAAGAGFSLARSAPLPTRAMEDAAGYIVAPNLRQEMEKIAISAKAFRFPVAQALVDDAHFPVPPIRR